MSSESNPLTCPCCGATMIHGEAKVEGTFWSALLAGYSVQHLWFRSSQGAVKKKVLASSSMTTAHLCQECGTLTIPPKKSFADRLHSAASNIATYIDERSKNGDAR